MIRSIVGICLLLAANVVAQNEVPGNDHIKADRLRSALYFVGSDELQGRLTATNGNLAASAYIRSRFEAIGLETVAEGDSYYHDFQLSTATLGQENRLSLQVSDHLERTFRPGQDYYPMHFSGSGTARGELVFAGYGIVAPGYGHEDYQGRAEGKVVLVLEHEPGERDPDSVFDGLVTSDPSRDFNKAWFAQEAGAVGVLFVSDVQNHQDQRPGTGRRGGFEFYWPDPPRRIPRYNLTPRWNRIHIPVATVSPDLVTQILAAKGIDFLELAKKADATGGIRPMTIQNTHVELTADVVRHVTDTRNVLGLVRGTDKSDELIIISAHYDHDGTDGRQIFNGADDDGSGTVGLMAIADAYAAGVRAGMRPRRSILFAAWNAEEQGLLGAFAYAEDPIFPLEKTVAVLNMDMIGRNEEVPPSGGRRFRGLEPQTAESNNNAVNILGYSRNPELAKYAELENEDIGLDLRFRYDNNIANLLRRSDQWPFLQQGIPAIFFHTGLHPDYHTEDDTPDKINYEKMEKIVRLVHRVSWKLAQADQTPKYESRVWWRK